MFEIEVTHAGLNKYRLIKSSDPNVLENKAAAQMATWDEMWEKKLDAEERKQQREAETQSKDDKKNLAITKTNEAQDTIQQLENTLAHTLTIDDAIDWDSLFNKKQYSVRHPRKPSPPKSPFKPDTSHAVYQPKLVFIDKILPRLRRAKEKVCHEKFLTDYAQWEKDKQKFETTNKNNELEFAKKIKGWKENKRNFEKKRDIGNTKITEEKAQYEKGELEAVIDYCDMVLANSEYPDYFPQEWELDYQEESKILIIDYSLPDMELLPTTKTVKYIIARDEFTETVLSQPVLNKLYDNLIYQISLRTIHELYEADVINALDSIVFNGWVDSTDKATGHNVNACIMSLQASKDEFLAINLDSVDPKTCFKMLKGVGSSKLHGLSPIAPIITIDKEDSRFTESYAVVDGLDEVDNLAAMDWQDFENLIRELFEKEFSTNGGEVKITQASRDGGVDAIAFDPDPIRGGKIVIQAKRYTNVVGVSAVRDLFGTTVNEGATKGILVTTANFGPDAYAFVKGKPLTLINGNNLLHLLAKHGHKAKIDLKEAKKILNDQ